MKIVSVIITLGIPDAMDRVTLELDIQESIEDMLVMDGFEDSKLIKIEHMQKED